MRRTYLLGILAVILLFSPSAQAWGQMFPGHRNRGNFGGYYGFGDDAGVSGAYTSALNSATTRNIAEQDRLAGLNAAQQQMAMVQSGIHNTLATQAQTRTQDILGQQQSNRDWWFQVEQQQLAQRRPVPASASAGGAAAQGFESAAPARPQPEAATDIIKWPAILCEPRFAQQRAAIEAPYRGPKGTAAIPTVDDYRKMIDVAEQMKAILGRMTGEMSAQDYLNTVKFLDQLAAEARERIAK